MSSPSVGSITIIDDVAATREQFIDVACHLRTRPEVRSASPGMDCRAYQSGTAIEFWVEAEVEGRIICWWLEARCAGGGWVVEAEVLENRDDRDGQEKLHRLEPRA